MQEILVLAEALGVPPEALLYSPLHPAEDVRPTPNKRLPAYAVPDHPYEARPGSFPKDDDAIDQGWGLMRQLNATRLQAELVANALDDARQALADLETRNGAVPAAPGPIGMGTERFSVSTDQIETQRRLVESFQAQRAGLERSAEALSEGLSDLGIEPWPADEQYSPFWALNGGTRDA